MSRCKYVLIPADLDQPIQELETELPEGKEAEYFLDLLKKHFARAGGRRTEEHKKAKRDALMKQCGEEAASKLSAEMWDTALSMNMVENIALLSNAPDTGFVAVNLYCDDEGTFKELPVNLRASDIAKCCGKMIEVRGDAFLGRIFDNEDDFKRLDFTTSEVSSSAQWVKDSAAQARRREARDSAQVVMDRMTSKGGASCRVKVEDERPADVEREKGNAMFKRGKWQEAVEHYSAAVKLDSTSIAAYNNRAMSYLKLKQFEACIADCGSVLGLDSVNVKALYRRACAYQACGRLEDAVKDLERAVELQPENKEAVQKLGEIQQGV